jgi:hypothetical protein
MFDRIYRIIWIFFFGRFPEENGQTQFASGENEHTHRFSVINGANEARRILAEL